MLTIGFVVSAGFPLIGLAALSVFEFANIESGSTLYEIVVMSEAGGPVATSSGVLVDTVPLQELHLDTVIIGGHTQILPTTHELSDFVSRARKSSRRLSSICTGVFALADAGLLDGRKATTHWAFAETFKTRFPTVRLIEDRIFVIDGSIWTAAGNSASIDLALRMLEDDHGQDLARLVARVLVVDYQRSGGQPQQSAILEINASSDRIQAALAFVRQNMSQPLSVERLAEIANVGPRQFGRAFLAETGMTPAKAIEKIRLDSARLMVEQGRQPIDAIARQTGFGDEERMRRAFVRVIGSSPQELRRAAQASREA